MTDILSMPSFPKPAYVLVEVDGQKMAVETSQSHMALASRRLYTGEQALEIFESAVKTTMELAQQAMSVELGNAEARIKQLEAQLSEARARAGWEAEFARNQIESAPLSW